LDANFNVDQIANAEGDKINTLKIPKQGVDPNLAPSLNRIQFQGFKFLEENLEDLKVTIEALKDRFDVPFDEMYHKEKRLVDAVIKATEALKKKEGELPNAMGPERMFRREELKGEYLSEEY
jgi:hypothetical protein